MARWLILFLFLGIMFISLSTLFQIPVSGQVETSFTAGVGTPILDGVESPGEWTGDSVTTMRGVTLKAMMDGESFYVLATWPDTTRSVSQNHWTWDGEQWNASEDEDRIAFIWEIKDAQGNSLNGEDGASCQTMCHPGEGMATNFGRVDVWHSKSTRFLPVGHADDKYWDTDGPDGRHSDDGGGSGDRNRNEAQTGPVYGPTNVTFLIDDEASLASFDLFGSTLGTAAVKELLDGTEQFAEGDTIPGRILKDPTGNRASVEAVGNWADDMWTVEFRRMRAGENGSDGLPQDFAVVPGGSVRFTTDIFDNLSEHGNHSFSAAGNSSSADFNVWTLNFPDPTTLYFSQVGGGGGFSADKVLTNPSEETTASGNISFFDDSGNPMVVDIALAQGELSSPFSRRAPLLLTDSLDFEIPPLGAITLSTSTEGDLAVGAAQVDADYPIGGVVRFSIPDIGIAGVGESKPLDGFISPVRRVAGGINTGLAIHNTGDEPAEITLSLRTVAQGEVGFLTIEDFPPHGHLARFIDELFPEVDTSNFTGTIVVRATGSKIAATVLELGSQPGQFTTLPVTPLE